ncbi:hypothetical protein [Flavobacterium lacus]|uniref:Uncharacterized protein n=1 Tax=Flavobacterium lacus TaxID=1353778 RepID=A0A328WP36_9FLAO|nr:hypothetical protein [Flavobacterium lacus]RAR48080.1 hypothetical protein B0I10_10681 [Flavobacterium lacus]
MSYDLMVFRKEAAPMTKTEFMDWYEDQTEWTEEHTYDDPANTSAALRNWFMEMIQTFPAMNGPFASEDDEENHNVADYCIGRDVIYVAFAWSLAEQAYSTMLKLAEKHGVGFFDASGDNGDIFFPENGQLKAIDNSTTNANKSSDGKTNKSWWKFW